MGLWRQLFLAWNGSIAWRCLKRKNGIRKNDVVIFLVEEDEELNHYAFLHAEKLLQKKYGNELAFISPYAEAFEGMPEGLKKYRRIIVSQSECEKIKKYYQLVRFSDYVCFVTLTWPESNWVSRLLGQNGINKEDIVCLGLYVLRYVPRSGEKTA